jgi:hypothetical protein
VSQHEVDTSKGLQESDLLLNEQVGSLTL